MGYAGLSGLRGVDWLFWPGPVVPVAEDEPEAAVEAETGDVAEASSFP